MEQDIEKIYRAHLETVYKYLFCLCHDKSLSEDLAQETFYIATKEIKKFRNESKIQVWLCQIAKNLWYKELRRKKKLIILSIDEEIGEIEADLDIEDNFIEEEQRIEVYKQIEELDYNMRELVYLRLTTDLTFADISQLLGKSESWARVTYYRWKTKMEKMNKDKQTYEK